MWIRGGRIRRGGKPSPAQTKDRRRKGDRKFKFGIRGKNERGSRDERREEKLRVPADVAADLAAFNVAKEQLKQFIYVAASFFVKFRW